MHYGVGVLKVIQELVVKLGLGLTYHAFPIPTFYRQLDR
jgi:hypothetical protein